MDPCIAERGGQYSRVARLSVEESADAVRWLRDSRLVRAISPAAVQQHPAVYGDTPFFFAGCSTSANRPLSTFLDMYCRTTLVQQLDMEPTEFVAELRRRWEEKRPRARQHQAYPLAPSVQSFETNRRSSSATGVRTPRPPSGCVMRSLPGR